MVRSVFSKCFLPVCVLSSHSIYIIFCIVQILFLMKSSLLLVSFMNCTFDVVSKNSSPSPKLSRFFPPILSQGRL
jgi:hypothetical protein